MLRKLLSKDKLGSLNCILIIILFSLIGMKALFHPGLFTAHDIWHQVVRLYYYSQAVADNQLPPYWISQLANGFGYPLFLFSYQLPWLISIPILKIGFALPATIKILFFLSYLGSGITMYLLVSHLTKEKLAALLSAILYLWLPYHFLIIFVGGSMGIAFVFTFLPLLFLGIHLIKEQSKFAIPVFSLGLAGMILSHIMHLIFSLPVILIFLLWSFVTAQNRINFLARTALGIMLGILISAFYLIPSAYYNQYTRVRQEGGFYEIYQRNFLNLSQLLYSKWGYGPIINNAKNGENSFQLGIAQWIGVFILFLTVIFNKLPKQKQVLSLSLILILSFLISILLMLDISKPVWQLIIKIAIIDFPFRLLLPATFIASVCASIVLAAASKKLRIPIFVIFIVIALYTNRNHININQYTNFPITSYLELETEKTTNTFHEYLPTQADPKLLNNPWNEVQGANINTSNLKRKTNLLSFTAKTEQEATASIGQFYFPGQNLYLDNKKMRFTVDKQGRIGTLIPEGSHNITVKYQETLLIRISRVLTLIALTITFLSLSSKVRH